MNDIHISDSFDEEYEAPVKAVENSAAKCPECGAELAFEGGCNSCKNCGWSKCDL